MIEVGSIVSNYKIISSIGKGGMGEVFLAEHIKLPRKAALKVINPEYASNEQIRERFINEAVILANLSHKNIINIYDFLDINGNLIIVMEYSAGIPLNHIIKKEGPLNEERCIKIFVQVLDAFSYAHSKGIVHRDIKPSNILLESGDIPKVLDFGIAKLMTTDFQLTKAGSKIGSLYYMSPEQILSLEITYATDIYSLGVTIYEMLTGRLPYDINTESDYQIQDRIVKRPIIPIRNINPNISPSTESIILKATQKEPENRFTSCEDFKKALLQKEITEVRNEIYDKTLIDQQISTQQINVKRKKSSNIIFIFVIVFIFLLTIGLVYYLLKDNNKTTEVSKTKSSDVSNTKEPSNDDKKNSETKLNTSSSKAEIEKLFNDWVTKLKTGNMQIMDFYDNSVNYYKKGYVSKDYVRKAKQEFYDKWNDIRMYIDDITITQYSDSKYKVEFDNQFTVRNSYTDKYLDAKTRNYLIFEKINGEWLITQEIEKFQYYVNKNY